MRLYPGLRKLVFACTMQVFRVTKVKKSKLRQRTIAKVDGEDLRSADEIPRAEDSWFPGFLVSVIIGAAVEIGNQESRNRPYRATVAHWIL